MKIKIMSFVLSCIISVTSFAGKIKFDEPFKVASLALLAAGGATFGYGVRLSKVGEMNNPSPGMSEQSIGFVIAAMGAFGFLGKVASDLSFEDKSKLAAVANVYKNAANQIAANNNIASSIVTFDEVTPFLKCHSDCNDTDKKIKVANIVNQLSILAASYVPNTTTDSQVNAKFSEILDNQNIVTDDQSKGVMFTLFSGIISST